MGDTIQPSEYFDAVQDDNVGSGDAISEEDTSQERPAPTRKDLSSSHAGAQSPAAGDNKSLNCYVRLRKSYPRSVALCCHVLVPLWVIIVLSMVLGAILASLEAPEEIDDNDLAMQVWRTEEKFRVLRANTLQNMPEICAVLWVMQESKSHGANEKAEQSSASLSAEMNNQTLQREELSDVFTKLVSSKLDLQLDSILEDLTSGNKSVLMLDSPPPSMTESEYELRFLDFLNDCGEMALMSLGGLAAGFESVKEEGVGASLTFNWNRCYNRTEYGRIGFIPDKNFRDNILENILPSKQNDYYHKVWLQDQEKLKEEFLATFLRNGMNASNAETAAFGKSVAEATGRSACHLNTASAGWFWFTVMTTVGYGNQAPTTQHGRSLVTTVGWLSILVFATILATTGNIIATILEVWLENQPCAARTCRRHPWLRCLAWGLSWYTWMAAIAGLFRYWWDDRLLTIDDGKLEFHEAYWFAFISTTTVGLGDFFPRPEVIIFFDLLVFSFMFLIGFVLLSAFFNDLAKLIGMHLVDVSDTLRHEICTGRHNGVMERDSAASDATDADKTRE